MMIPGGKEDDVSHVERLQITSTESSTTLPASDLKKVLRVGAIARLATLDPRRTHDTVSSLILDEIFETLFTPPLGSEAPTPQLVTDPLRKEPGATDRPVYSAELRSDVVFSDGTPMTPQHVAASLNSAADFARQATVEVRGARLFFTLARPNPRFDLVLTNTYTHIVLERGGTLVGSGPFMFPSQMRMADVPRMDRITLIRNPHFNRKPVDIDEVVFTTYAASTGGGTEVLLDAARRGEIDFTYSLTSVDAISLRGYPFVPSISTGNATGILYFNSSRPSLDDVQVRKAFAHAIDRKAIAESTYDRNPLAYVASNLLPPLLARDSSLLGFDLTRAKAFAAAAGSRMPKKVSLVMVWSPRPYMPNPRRAGELIREQLAAIGVEVELIATRDRVDYAERVERNNYDMLLAGWIADTSDPSDFFEALLASYSIPSRTNNTATSNNVSRFSSPAMDAALARFRAEPTDANRASIVALLAAEAPLLPVIYGQAVAVCSRNVSGFQHSALGRVSLAGLKMRPPVAA